MHEYVVLFSIFSTSISFYSPSPLPIKAG